MANVLAAVFWPALGLGLVLAVAWRFVAPGWLRTALQIAASVLVFIPQLLIILFLYRATVLLLYQEALLSAWMLGIAGLTAFRLWQRWTNRGSAPALINRLSCWRATEQEIAFQTKMQRTFWEQGRQRSSPVLVLVVLLFGGFGAYLGRNFLLDAFARRIVVEGMVQGLRYNHGSRAPRPSSIIIDSHVWAGARDLHAQIQYPQWVHAEIGAGSHAVLRLTKATPAQARSNSP